MTDGDWRRVATTHSLTTPQVWRRRFLRVKALALYPSVHWGFKRKQKRYFMPWAKGVFTCFSPNSVSTLRDSYGRCKSRRGSLGLRHFTCKFPYKVALVKPWHVFRLRRLAESLRRGFGPRIFSCKFPYKVALLKSRHAFQLRRPAQSLRCAFGPRHFSCKFPYKVVPCEILTCVSTAQARTKCVSAFRLRKLAQSVGPGLGIGLPPQHHHLPSFLHHPPRYHPHHQHHHHHHDHHPLTIIIIIIVIIIIISSSSPPSSPSSSSSSWSSSSPSSSHHHHHLLLLLLLTIIIITIITIITIIIITIIIIIITIIILISNIIIIITIIIIVIIIILYIDIFSNHCFLDLSYSTPSSRLWGKPCTVSSTSRVCWNQYQFNHLLLGLIVSRFGCIILLLAILANFYFINIFSRHIFLDFSHFTPRWRQRGKFSTSSPTFHSLLLLECTLIVILCWRGRGNFHFLFSRDWKSLFIKWVLL